MFMFASFPSKWPLWFPKKTECHLRSPLRSEGSQVNRHSYRCVRWPQNKTKTKISSVFGRKPQGICWTHRYTIKWYIGASNSGPNRGFGQTKWWWFSAGIPQKLPKKKSNSWLVLICLDSVQMYSFLCRNKNPSFRVSIQHPLGLAYWWHIGTLEGAGIV